MELLFTILLAFPWLLAIALLWQFKEKITWKKLGTLNKVVEHSEKLLEQLQNSIDKQCPSDGFDSSRVVKIVLTDHKQKFEEVESKSVEIVDAKFIESQSPRGWFKCDRCWVKIEWVKARSSCGKYLCRRCFNVLADDYIDVLKELNVTICLDV